MMRQFRAPALSVTAVLLAVNLAAFVRGFASAGGSLWPTRITQFELDYGLWGPEVGLDGQLAIVGRQLVRVGENLELRNVYAVLGDEWWRIFTGGFLHSGIAHIAFNMLFLWLLGNRMEKDLGAFRFFFLYFGALVGGACGALLFDPNAVTVGASGAVFGLMGGALVGKRLFGNLARESGLLGLLVLNIVISFAFPGISLGGHLGGLAGGALIVLAYSAINKLTQDSYYRQRSQQPGSWETAITDSAGRKIASFDASSAFRRWRKLEASLSCLSAAAIGTGLFWVAILLAERARS